MQIDTGYSLLGTPQSAGGSSTARRTTQGPSFGPAAQVSLGIGVPVTGFNDYTQLSSNGVWQFDLTAVLSTTQAALETQAISPEQQKAEEEAVSTAFTYIDEGDYDAARKLIQSVLDQNKTNASAVQALGYVELGEGDYKKAEQYFLKAHALAPTVGYDSDARNARTLQKDDATVLNTARAMVNTPTQRADGIRLLITLTQRSENFTGARLALADAMQADGDSNNALMQYNSALRTADRTDLEAIEERLTGMAETNPDSAFLQQLIGKSQMGLGKWETAVQTLKRATELGEDGITYARDLARAYVGLARSRLADGDVSGAMTSLLAAKDLSATDADVKLGLAEGYVARAEQLSRLHSYSDAVSDYGRAADLLGTLGNDDLRTRAARGAYSLGRTLEHRRIAAGEDIDGEVVAYQAAYDLDTDNDTYRKKLAATRNAIGDQHAADGEWKEAAGAYQRAYELDKHNETYRDSAIDSWMTYGDDKLYNLNYDDAIEAFRNAYELDLENLTSKDRLATAYNARGLDHISWERMKDAALDFKEALRLFPDNATYQANYDRVKAWDV